MFNWSNVKCRPTYVKEVVLALYLCESLDRFNMVTEPYPKPVGLLEEQRHLSVRIYTRIELLTRWAIHHIIEPLEAPRPM